MKQQRTQLEATEAGLLSYDRLEKIANLLKMVDPVPEQVQFLDGKSKSAEARNNMPAVPDGTAAR